MLWAAKAMTDARPPTLLHGKMMQWYIEEPGAFMRALTRFSQIGMMARRRPAPKEPEAAPEPEEDDLWQRVLEE